MSPGPMYTPEVLLKAAICCCGSEDRTVEASGRSSFASTSAGSAMCNTTGDCQHLLQLI